MTALAYIKHVGSGILSVNMFCFYKASV